MDGDDLASPRHPARIAIRIPREGTVSLSRKRKKELRKLQSNAQKLWESQQVLMDQVGGVAREAGRQLSNYNREQVQPAIHDGYEKYAAPYVEKGARAGRRVYNNGVVPAAGAVGGRRAVAQARLVGEHLLEQGADRLGVADLPGAGGFGERAPVAADQADGRAE